MMSVSQTVASPTNAVASHASVTANSFTGATAIVLYIAAAKLLLHLVTAGQYGLFRDELYYLACSQHLAFGYVDQPPLIALIAWLARHVFGESMLGLRVLPALAGTALVWVTGRLAREMGGGGFAQALAALAVAVVPFYLILQHWLTMNAFEPLIWMSCAWCMLRAIKTSNARYCLAFGVLAGLGMENKYSIAFFVTGTLLGLLLTPARRFFADRWFWFGVAAAFAIFLPNLIWLARQGFPFLELMHHVRMSGRDIARTPLYFIVDQAMVHNPILFPLWFGGLIWLLMARQARPYRALGIAFLSVLSAFIVLKGKNYYVSPVYPMLFAAGAVALEDLTRQRLRWIRPAYLMAILVFSAAIVPIMVPILQPATFLRYHEAFPYPTPEFEHQRNGPLPQYFADEFGWEEMVKKTADVYHSLSPVDQAKAAIFANNYGEASAVDFYGPRYGLPQAISPHQNFWLWGPDGMTGGIAIVLGSDGKGDRDSFQTVEASGEVAHPYSRRDEHFTIWLCRGLKFEIHEAWPSLKNWS